eukprot:COSAG05_NODE_3077_length_2348_cov_6.091152_2_plen_49_part_00
MNKYLSQSHLLGLVTLLRFFLCAAAVLAACAPAFLLLEGARTFLDLFR